MDINIVFPAEVTEAFKEIAGGMKEQRQVNKEFQDLVMPFVRLATPVAQEFAKGMKGKVDSLQQEAAEAGNDLVHIVMTNRDAQKRMLLIPDQLSIIQDGLGDSLTRLEREFEVAIQAKPTSPEAIAHLQKSIAKTKAAINAVRSIVEIISNKD